jgi:serine/threonine protein kinase
VHGVALGLEYLHANDVVHGDLKAVWARRTHNFSTHRYIFYQQNVLIDKRGVACLCDFGISRIIGEVSTYSAETMTYIAPELFFVMDRESTNVTPPRATKNSDIYSFALLVLEVHISPRQSGRSWLI